MSVRYSLCVRGLAAVVAAGVGTATPVAAAPAAESGAAESAELRAALVIEADALGEEGGPSMEYLLSLLEDKVLRERGVGPATSDADPRIVVVVQPLSDKAGMFDNRVDISIEQGGEAWSDARWGFDCELCDDGRLLDRVAVELHAAVTRLEEETATTASETDGSGSDEGQVTPPGSSADSDPVKPGPLVWVGTAIAIVGVSGVAVGLPFAFREDRIDGAPGDLLVGKQTRTPGWAITGVGAAALVTGGVLLGIGLHRWKRDKEKRSSSTAIVVPWADPHGAGLSATARF